MKYSLLKSLLISTIFSSSHAWGEEAAPTKQASEEGAPIEANTTSGEMKKIQAQLRDLHDQIKAVPKTASEPGLGPQLTEASKAFAYATEAYQAKDWLTVIQECSRFLSLSQKPNRELWLKAHFMIGRAYEEQGQSQRAVRAYRRYLAAFTTEPTKNLTDLTETFERLVRIATKSKDLDQAELSKFLSSIAAMEYPSDVSSELQYFVAVASSNIGKRQLATNWLSHVDSNAKSAETKARAKYFRALLAINSKDWDAASFELEAILQMDEISRASRDNARLSLARVFLKQKKPELSLKTYNGIDESSEAYRDALFERTFLLTRMGRGEEARSAAKKWLEKYPDQGEAPQVRGMLSWLELRAGDLAGAKREIDSTAAKLLATREMVQNDFQASKLRYEDAIRLDRITRGLVTPATELDEILALFNDISELEQRISDIDGAQKSIIYTIAHGDLSQYKPSLTNRLNQYDHLAEKVLDAGADLISIEKRRLVSTLTDLDKQKLNASEKRRTDLFGKRSQLARLYKRWATWAEPAEQLVKLATEWEQLNALQASFNAQMTQHGQKNEQLRSDSGSEISKKMAELRKEMIRTLTEIKKLQGSSIVEQSSVNDVLYIVQQYASALHEESQIISNYEPQSGKILDSFDDEDSRTAWALWQDAIGTLHTNIKDLKTQASKDLANSFADLERIDTTKRTLENDLKHLKDILETYAGESLAGIKAHYDNELSQRIARQYKWAGDLEYLTYVKAKSEHDDLSRRQALEAQILSDNLREIEQGGASQWPR